MHARPAVSRESISRSIALARIILFAITLALIVAAVIPAFAQPPGERNVAPALAQSKADRFARMTRFESQPTANQLDYDVLYYDLDLEMIPSTETITGTVTMVARVLASSIASVDLDLETTGMTVTQTKVGGETVPFTHTNDILSVTTNVTYTTDEIFTVEVTYSGTPDPSYGAFGFDTYAGDDMIWSLSEPFGARSWWPCKDDPSDKADSVDVRITVPSNLIVVSNGALVSATSVSPSKVQYHWHEEYPISTYLVSVAIHPYTTYSDWYHYAPSDSMEIQFFVFPDHYSYVQTNYAKVPDMMTVYAGLFGEYPFLDEKYGHAEFLWGGGMEHQTCTSLGTWNEGVIAHELAHQWFGDLITCDDFHHIWINEGFATYCEALWQENEYGEPAYWSEMLAAKYLGPGTIYVPDTSDWNRIFDSGLSYNKGSWVLHMLRHVLGDATFFTCLQTYVTSTHAYGNATTEEFRDLCEAVSGMDLDWFFHQWIYEEYYPTYSYQWSANPSGMQWDVSLDIEQLQSNYIYKMPVDITVEFAAGETTLVVWDSLATQSFALTVDQEPVAVSLDKDQWILRSVEEQISNPTFHRGVLLVNGVDMDVYGPPIRDAYSDSAFTADYPFTFWDCFASPPSGGYPAALPAPIGTGPVPADTLGQFSTVVWIGNNYNGDLAPWYETPIHSFLMAGGNVVLLSRMGQDFLTGPLRDYLGITWVESAYNTLANCVSMYPGLENLGFTSTQSYCSVFDTTLATPETKLLFAELVSFSSARGIGAWRKPVGGGLHRTTGAQFAFIGLRPYYLDRPSLEYDMEVILYDLIGEPKVPVGVEDEAPRPLFALRQNFPNPFNPHTTIRFNVPTAGPVTLSVYDVAGRLVSTVVSRPLAAGPHSVAWDGTDHRGARVASGVYFYRLEAGAHAATRKMVLLR